MCGKSLKLGTKIILLCALFALLASPLFAASYLEGILGVRGQTQEEVSLAPSVRQLPETSATQTQASQESYQEILTQLPAMSETELLAKVEELSLALETESISYQNQLAEVSGLTESLKLQLESLKSENQITDAQYDEVLASLNDLASKNATQADQIAYDSGYKAGIASKDKTKFFANAGFVLGFENSSPTWGITGNLGMKFGKGFMVSTGISYMLGDFVGKPFYTSWDIDNLTISLTAGWEW